MAESESPAITLDTNPMTVNVDALRSWKQFERDATACTRCGLSETRTKVVFGDGNTEADLMIIGDAPGRHEDLQGKPFAGAAGNLLDNLLADAGLGREDCYITDVVKCLPPERDPQAIEIETCGVYLIEQIARVKPKVIVTLGELPTTFVLRRRMPIGKLAGYRFDVYDGVTLIPTFAPVAALRGNARAMASIKRDLRTAKAVLDGRMATGAEAMADVRARQTEDGGQ